MRATVEQHGTLAAAILKQNGARAWPQATRLERATLVLDSCAAARIDVTRITPLQLAAAMAVMPAQQQDIPDYLNMACALAAALPRVQSQSVNADLLDALTKLSDMYARTWDRVDGALMCMPESIPLFEEAHAAASAAIAKATQVSP